MLKAYLPALVFLFLGAAVGTAFTFANRFLGPRRPTRVKREPYESGLPSDVRKGFRFGIPFYLVGMLFIVFDMEVILLYPTALAMGESAFALGAITLFIFFLAVAFVYEWRRGALDWSEHPAGHAAPRSDEEDEHQDSHERAEADADRDHAGRE